jgi:translation initiation factor 1
MAKLIKKEQINILYADDGSHKEPKKKTMEEFDPKDVTLSIRREKSGRGGKTVSVIYDLPDNELYFKALTKKLKSHCGTGGSFKEGRIEIQGDKLARIQEHLEKIGFKVKKRGG